MQPHPEFSADLDLALGAARAAGDTILRFFRRSTEVHYKEPGQPVTEADLAADRLLKRLLLETRSEYGWLSEETADSPDRLDTSRVWIVDPIDGTRSFIDGHPEFAVSIGLAEAGKPVLGVVYNPATDEMYHALAGGGAFRNGDPIRVSVTSALPGSMFASRSEIRRGEFASFQTGWTVQPLGSTAYKMVRVADGSGDVFLSRGPKSEWDVCGAALIVAEAGGQVSDAAGAALHFNRADPHLSGVLATNGMLHDRILDHVKDTPGLNPGNRSMEG
jgi:myo-inositol-1(or 4)-monophosphatase